MAAADILKYTKSRYLGKGLTDHQEIWHSSTFMTRPTIKNL